MKEFLKRMALPSRAAQHKQLKLTEQTNSELRLITEELREIGASLSNFIGDSEKRQPIPLSVRENIDTLRKLAMKPLYSEIDDKLTPRIMSMETTMREISDNRMSLSRFGDGEFKAMLRLNGNLKFQDTSPKLRHELTEILQNDDRARNHLIGFPEILPGPHWTNVWADYYYELEPLIEGIQKFANSHVTRPVFFMQWRANAIESWRKVFNRRRICVVTGYESRFELLPELFGGATEVEFVRGPSQHAYDDIGGLKSEVLRTDCDLALFSLGPAGTVLSRRLADSNIQALDVGHISASFHTAFNGAPMPEFTPFK